MRSVTWSLDILWKQVTCLSLALVFYRQNNNPREPGATRLRLNFPISKRGYNSFHFFAFCSFANLSFKLILLVYCSFTLLSGFIVLSWPLLRRLCLILSFDIRHLFIASESCFPVFCGGEIGASCQLQSLSKNQGANSYVFANVLLSPSVIYQSIAEPFLADAR